MVQVSGADYADCSGLYTLTNLSSVWDTKHIVYTRLDTGNTEQRSGSPVFPQYII